MTRIHCAQFAPTLGNLERNISLIGGLLDSALQGGANIVLFPELATSGYLFRSAEELRGSAIGRDHPAFANWASQMRLSDGGNSTMVIGFAEADPDGSLYSSSAIVDSGGIRSIYRKTHLWDLEKNLFSPGATLPEPVITEHGTLMTMVCYDLEFPEMTRYAALAGADLIVAPVNWPVGPPHIGTLPAETIQAMAAARSSGVAIAICDRSGTERGQDWESGSVIIDARGRLLAELREAGIIVAELDLLASRDKTRGALADLFADRRTDLY